MKNSPTLLEVIPFLHLATLIPLVPLSCTVLFVALFFTSYWYISALYAIWYVYDRKAPYQGGHRLSLMRNFFLWKHMANYLPVKLHKTADLDPSKNYIFAYHPHALAPFGGLVNFASNATGFDETFPGITVHVLTVNLQFAFPFFREYIMSAGMGSVDAVSIDYKLTKLGPGHSVFIAVGGAAEIMLINHNAYLLKLKERKGFIRRALKTGALIVPVFGFSEHRLFNVSYPEKGSWSHFIQRAIRFIYHVDLPLDVRGYPGYYCTVPFRQPVNIVVGEPIDFTELKKAVRKGEDPPEELVDECHRIYLEALRKLYDDNKARFGDENTPLTFV